MVIKTIKTIIYFILVRVRKCRNRCRYRRIVGCSVKLKRVYILGTTIASPLSFGSNRWKKKIK